MDKISILEIKQKNIKDKQKIKIISKELESLNYSLKKDVHITDEIKTLYEDLKKINIKLWNIEDGKKTVKEMAILEKSSFNLLVVSTLKMIKGPKLKIKSTKFLDQIF